MTVCLTCENQKQCDVLEKLHCECSNYKMLPTKAETNYDRIISKTPEELAEWFAPQGICPPGKPYGNGCSGECAKCWLEWLLKGAADA